MKDFWYAIYVYDIIFEGFYCNLSLYNFKSKMYWRNIIMLTDLTDLVIQPEGIKVGVERPTNSTIKLPSVARECAKAILNCIYKIDLFENLEPYMIYNPKNIKIDTSGMDGNIAKGNFLRYVFARPSSKLYSKEDSGSLRTFENETYHFKINGIVEECRLSTQWCDWEVDKDNEGNNLNALIQVVNECYSGLIKITEEPGSRYLYILNNTFTLNRLPESFRTDFSRRYITSLLAKPFVILTGNSGTGKTRIAKLLAEYFEVQPKTEEKNWVLVPVGADWTDNTNILGFYNPLADENKGKYVKTSIIKLIESANKNKNIPYFLILDEMNLSHVERYFSDFLSHMETPEIPFVLDGYEGELKFTSNIFVIGTVNIDETTYMFSPKVLDRANVIEFKPEKTAVMNLFLNPVNSSKMHAANDGSAEMFLKLSKEIRSGKCKIDTKMKDVQGLFDKIYQVTEKYEYEFAYRTVKEIRQYISAAYELEGETDEFNLTDSMDEQLLQKILPKIHGNKKEIGELLEELEKICIDNKLTLSEKKLKQMKGKVARVQYASFI